MKTTVSRPLRRFLAGGVLVGAMAAPAVALPGPAATWGAGTLVARNAAIGTVSADGRYVAYLTPYPSRIIRSDLVTKQLREVSVSTAGVRANRQSVGPVFAKAGQYVFFVSEATNLVAGDTNGQPDVFLRRLDTGTTELVSRTSTGGIANRGVNGAGPQGWVSSDGRYVAFSSPSTNLVPGDTNGFTDVFVRDRVAGTTTRVSTGSDGRQLTTSSRLVSISADGRWIAMQTGFDARGLGTIYVHDRATGRRSAASVMPDGSVSHLADGAFLTADGKHLFFVARDASTVALPDGALWMRELATGRTTFVTSAAMRVQSASTDGRFVVYVDVASTWTWTCWVFDRQTASGVRLSRGYVTPSPLGAISADGRRVIYDDGNSHDVFTRTRTSA